MHIHIIWIGKTKEKYLLEGIKKYQKLLNIYAKTDITEIQGAAKIEQSCKDGIEYFWLDESGDQYDSKSFQEFIFATAQWSGKIGFVIGDAKGFDPRLKKGKKLLSLSSLTFPHDMVRVILLEQLYRSCTLEYAKTYHY